MWVDEVSLGHRVQDDFTLLPLYPTFLLTFPSAPRFLMSREGNLYSSTSACIDKLCAQSSCSCLHACKYVCINVRENVCDHKVGQQYVYRYIISVVQVGT